MSKILIASDIHLNDYHRFNTSNGARLQQFNKLSSRLIEIADQYNCDVLILAGDIIDKPTNRPYIIDSANEFLGHLGERFKTIKYILGQHDLDSKNEDHRSCDSVVHILMPSNAEYCDKKIWHYEGRSIAFMDWRREQNLNWIEEPVDLFIGHVTVDPRFGQYIDTSKFKLGIVGDIHHHGVVGNLVKIGVPFQHSMNDQNNGTVVIYDTEDNSYEHVLTDPDNTRFLQMYYTDNKSIEGFSEDKLKYFIYRPKYVSNTGVKISDISTSNTIEDLIDEKISEKKLDDIHSVIKNNVTQIPVIDFNFSLISIEIENFRSIKHLKHNFSKNTIVTGLNGSGKSSFILAIHKALIGDRLLMHNITFGESKMRLFITLSYGGRIIEITRGSTFKLTIDGVDQHFNNKTQFDNEVFNVLPFLRYIDSFYFNYYNTELLSSMNNAKRVDIISKYNRLDVLDSYNNEAINQCAEINAKITELSKEETRLIASIERDNQLSEELKSRITELTNSMTRSREQIDLLPEIRESKIIKAKIDNLNELINYHKSFLNFDNEELLKAYDQKVKFENEINSIKDQIQSLSNTKNKLDKISFKLNELNTKYNTISKTITDLDNNEEVKCHVCGSIITDKEKDKYKESLVKTKSELENSIATENNERTNLLSSLDIGSLSIDEYVLELHNKKNQINNNYISLVSNIGKLESDRNQYNTSKEIIADCNDKLNEYLNKKVTVIPSDNEISELENNYKILVSINELQLQLDGLAESDLSSELLKVQDRITDKKYTLSRFVEYRDLTSKAGEIYRLFLNNLSERLSDHKYQFSALSQRATGNDYFDITVKMKVDNKFVDYKDLSSGQKTLADLYFISKIINNGGILVFDEFLRFVDKYNYDEALDFIMNTDINQTILSTHNSNAYINNADTLHFTLINNESITELN